MKNVLLKKSAALTAAALLLLNVPAHVLAADNEAAANAMSGMPKLDYQQLKAALAKASSAETASAPILSPSLDTKSTGSVNVIVRFSKEPVAVGRYAAQSRRQAFSAQTATQAIQQEQAAFVSASKAKGVSLKVNRKFNTVLNGMEITVRADQLPTLAKLPGVVGISENLTYYPLAADGGGAAVAAEPVYEEAPLKQIGVDKAWAEGYTGKGMKVAVLDTGVDYMHPDLNIAGGYDAFYQDEDPYEEPPLTPMQDPLGLGFEGTQHGTHVSGTIAGRARNTAASQVQKGVAYEADLYVYKVLGRASNGLVSGSSATIIDGLERAVQAGVDVINMSLGADENKNPNSPDSIAVNNAVLAGVTVVVANGNAATQGPYYYSMGTPSAAQLAFSVGAATSPSDIPIYSASVAHQISGQAPSDAKPLKLAEWKTGQEDFEALFGADPIEAAYVGLGKDADYKNVNVTGKIAFVSRGDNTFVEKIANAKKHGALAVIMFNGNSKVVGGATVPDLTEDQAGRNGLIGLDSGPGPDNIPTFDMAGVEGRAIARQLTAGAGKTLSFTFEAIRKLVNEGDHMADFSSRGPNSDGNFGIKPDLVGPGVNIYSTWPMYGKVSPGADYSQAYMRESGTSMATPHVAGLALLVKEAHRDWSPLDIRAALDNTSESIRDESGTRYDVYSQGAGRANVASAIATPALLKSMDPITIYDSYMNATQMASEAGSVSFGLIDAGSQAVSKPLELENKSNEALTYKASVEMHPQVTSDPDPLRAVPTPDASKIGMNLEGLSDDGTLTVAPGGDADFELTAEAQADAADGVYEGEVVLASEGLPTLHLPFVLHVGEDSDPTEWGVTDMKASDAIAAPDHPIDVTAKLNAKDIQQILLVAMPLDPNGAVCLVSSMYDEELAAIPTGPIKFEQIDGSCIDIDDPQLDDEGNYILGQLDGLYELELFAQHIDKTTGQADYDHMQVAYTTVKFSKTNIGTPGDGDPGDGDPGDGDPGNGNPGDGNPGTGNPGTGGPGGLPGGGNGGETPPASAIVPTVVEQGQTAIAAETSSALQGDRLVATVTDDALQRAIAAAKQSPAAITLTAADKNAAEAQLQLTPAQVDLLRKAPANSSIVFTWNESSSVAFPLSALAGASEGAGLNVRVAMNAAAKATFQAAYPEAELLGDAYAFEAEFVLNGKTVPAAFKPEQSFKRSFAIAQSADTATAGVLYEEDGSVSPVAATFKTAAGSTIVTIDRPGLSTYVAAKRRVAFADIGASWAKEDIQSLADMFLLNGTTAGKFEPKANVTRAQFASMLVRGLGLQTASEPAPFGDVAPKDWFAQDVAAAYAAGLVEGADGQFRPNAQISRQDLTVMLARAAELLKLTKPSGTHKPYADASQISAYAQASVQTVSDFGLMQGYETKGGTAFDPRGATSREAVAKVLRSLLRAAGLIQ